MPIPNDTCPLMSLLDGKTIRCYKDTCMFFDHDNQECSIFASNQNLSKLKSDMKIISTHTRNISQNTTRIANSLKQIVTEIKKLN